MEMKVTTSCYKLLYLASELQVRNDTAHRATGSAAARCFLDHAGMMWRSALKRAPLMCHLLEDRLFDVSSGLRNTLNPNNLQEKRFNLLKIRCIWCHRSNWVRASSVSTGFSLLNKQGKKKVRVWGWCGMDILKFAIMDPNLHVCSLLHSSRASDMCLW